LVYKGSGTQGDSFSTRFPILRSTSLLFSEIGRCAQLLLISTTTASVLCGKFYPFLNGVSYFGYLIGSAGQQEGGLAVPDHEDESVLKHVFSGKH